MHILVFSKSWSEHLQHLNQVLQALEKERLFCNRKKCQFGLSQVKFLGHVATGYSLSPDPEKLQAVTNWPIPKSITEVRRFFWLNKLLPALYSRIFISFSTAGSTERKKRSVFMEHWTPGGLWEASQRSADRSRATDCRHQSPVSGSVRC